MSPRPFERPATIALPTSDSLPAGASLEGLWLPPRGDEGSRSAGFEDDSLPREPVIARGGAIVAPPHPLMGGSMDSPVATEIALATSDAGYTSLRFNWRGVGASTGSPSGEVEDADADYQAAIEFMEESVEGPLLACGYSWGALAAARNAISSQRVRRLVLVAPPAAFIDGEALAAWGHPICVIVGDSDTYVPIDELREKLAGIKKADLTVLAGVDHFFMSGLPEVSRCVREALGS